MIIYNFHGFNSTGKSDKVKFLEKNFRGAKVISPSWNCANVNESVDRLEKILLAHPKNEKIVLMGISMGGYLALHLSRVLDCNGYKHVCFISINPVLSPKSSLRHFLGKNINFDTQETYVLSEDSYSEVPCIKPELIQNKGLLLLDRGDELLDSFKTLDLFKFSNHVRIYLYPNGEHRFERFYEIIESIKDFVGN
ncbi:YqiA/YcfP family alpha/beta fold hydrolase [Ancylomarina sp. YFZ004]